MTRPIRISIGVVVVLALIAAVLAGDALQRNASSPAPDNQGQTRNGEGGGNNRNADSLAGAIPIFADETQVAAITADALEDLEMASFVDAEEGRTQRGWLLRDILPTVTDTAQWTPETTLTIRSSARDKAVTITWGQIDDAANNVLFDLSGRGTFKLVSEGIQTLDTRDEWVQDVDRIDIALPAATETTN